MVVTCAIIINLIPVKLIVLLEMNANGYRFIEEDFARLYNVLLKLIKII